MHVEHLIKRLTGFAAERTILKEQYHVELLTTCFVTWSLKLNWMLDSELGCWKSLLFFYLVVIFVIIFKCFSKTKSCI